MKDLFKYCLIMFLVIITQFPNNIGLSQDNHQKMDDNFNQFINKVDTCIFPLNLRFLYKEQQPKFHRKELCCLLLKNIGEHDTIEILDLSAMDTGEGVEISRSIYYSSICKYKYKYFNVLLYAKSCYYTFYYYLATTDHEGKIIDKISALVIDSRFKDFSSRYSLLKSDSIIEVVDFVDTNVDREYEKKEGTIAKIQLFRILDNGHFELFDNSSINLSGKYLDYFLGKKVIMDDPLKYKNIHVQ